MMARFPALYSKRFRAKMNADEPPKQRFSHKEWLTANPVECSGRATFRLVDDEDDLAGGEQVVAFTWQDGPVGWRYIPVHPVVRVKMGRA